jgi:hypothetical protein
VLARCREKAGADCTVVMEDNHFIKPIVTGRLKTRPNAN